MASNDLPHHCLLNRLFRRRSKKISKLWDTGLCAGNSPATGEFTMASNAENFNLMTSSCFANFLLIHLTKPYSVNMVEPQQIRRHLPTGRRKSQDFYLPWARIDANLTLARTGICNELVQCKIYKKSAIFSSIFSLVHSTRKIFCMEIIGTPHQSVEFLWVTGKWKHHVSIFRSQYQNKFFMSSLFARSSSNQPITVRSALMYECYHSINLTWNVLTTMIHTKFRVKFRQRCY